MRLDLEWINVRCAELTGGLSLWSKNNKIVLSNKYTDFFAKQKSDKSVASMADTNNNSNAAHSLNIILKSSELPIGKSQNVMLQMQKIQSKINVHVG